MARVRYGVAMSLDGYIAGPNGEADWIVIEPEFDFGTLWAQFDTALMGRKTYDAAVARLGESAFQEIKTFVVSRTLRPADHPKITVIPELNQEQVRAVRAQSRKDVWLFGGGELFRTLLAMQEVDAVEVSLIPVLLGGGVPLLPPPAQRASLKLVERTVYSSGRCHLTYDVVKTAAAK